MHLGLNIKYLRKAKKISQDDLGELLGVSRSQISAYESENSEPPISKLIKLADYFKVNIQDLLFTDLSKEAPKFKEPEVPYSQQDEDTMIAELNDQLRKRVLVLEKILKESDPDLAKEWGIE